MPARRKPPQELLWEELVEVAKEYMAKPPYQELEEYFAAACLAKIKAIVRAFVSRKEFGQVFIHEGISLSQENLTVWMRGERHLDNPEALKGWLWKLAMNATVSTVREWIGRKGRERGYVPTETEMTLGKEGGEEVTVHFLEEGEGREAALQCPQYQSAFYTNPDKLFEQQEEKEILAKLFDIYGQEGTKRDRECTLWIKVRIEEDLSVEEIARRRDSTPDDVWHLFRHDVLGLRHLYRERFARRT